MSITTTRQEAVDFAMPFMNTGVGILYKKKAPPPPNLFSFLKPLSVDVWMYMITFYLATSILMFLLGRYVFRNLQYHRYPIYSYGPQRMIKIYKQL